MTQYLLRSAVLYMYNIYLNIYLVIKYCENYIGVMTPACMYILQEWSMYS